jgi:hypothetical protein
MNLKTARTISKEELGDYDLLELVAFAHKVDAEGLSYACSDYPPRFKRDDYAYSEDRAVLEILLERFEKEVAAFWEQDEAGKLYNAHIDESRTQERLLT